MPTANPILIPELRVMLAEGDTTGLREVAEELHPATVAEFTEGLDDAEIWRMLDAVPVDGSAPWKVELSVRDTPTASA
jgi:magnesium transporter